MHNWYQPARAGQLDEHQRLLDRMLAFTDGRLAEWDAINHIIGWGHTMATVTGSNEIYAQIIRHARSKTDTPLYY